MDAASRRSGPGWYVRYSFADQLAASDASTSILKQLEITSFEESTSALTVVDLCTK